ncbi:MAG: hypothetical protein H6744_19560 [Deltaproteobacteria bacterium]|nr:hypothetical protein [Deltaproteobacteria bacterium]MCB9788879.1 hypothetical protein [Deltaproteobacteria bacterium]
MSETTRQVDFAQVVDAIKAHRGVLIAPMILVPALAFVWANVVPPKLSASARLLVEDAADDQPGLRDLQVRMAVNQRLPAIHTIVRSSDTIEHVLRELGEIGVRTTPQEIEGLVESFRNQIDVWSEGGGIVHLKVVGRKPGRVYRGLALLTDALIAELVRPHSQALDESVKFLRSQVERVQGELTQLEEDLRAFKQEHPDALPEMQRANMGEVERLSRALIEARGELAANLERQRLFEESLARFDPATEKAADRLAAARAKLRGLQATYTDAHPEVKAAMAVVAERQAALAHAEAESNGDKTDPLERFVKLAGESKDRGAARSYQELVSDTEALKEKIDFLAVEEGKARERLKSAAEHDQAYQTLTLAQAAKSRVYQDLLARYEDSVVSRSLAGYESSSRIRVIDAARAPASPPKQPMLMVMAIGLIGGFVLGVTLLFLLELLDPSVRSGHEAARIVGAPVLGSVGGRGATEAPVAPTAGAVTVPTPRPAPLRRATGVWEAYSPVAGEPSARPGAAGPWSLDPSVSPTSGLRRRASGVSWPVFKAAEPAAGEAGATGVADSRHSLVIPRRFDPVGDDAADETDAQDGGAADAPAQDAPDAPAADEPQAASASATAKAGAPAERVSDITAQYVAPVASASGDSGPQAAPVNSGREPSKPDPESRSRRSRR